MSEKINIIQTRPGYLDKAAAAMFVGLSVKSMERAVAAGKFPKPRQLTTQRVGWLVRSLDEWCESRPESSILPVANCGKRAELIG